MVALNPRADGSISPEYTHSKKYLDFGIGFYITTFENQAKKWAVRKGMRKRMKNGLILYVRVEKGSN